MNDYGTEQIQRLIERLNGTDPAHRTAAQEEIWDRSYGRLRRLASKILHQDFSRLEHRHETGTVLHEAWPSIDKLLEQAHTANVSEFFALAAKRLRRTLIDLARAYDRRGGAPVSLDRRRPEDGSEASGSRKPEAIDHELPDILAQWADFHLAVEQLPERHARSV